MTDQTKLLTNDRSSLNNNQDQFFEEPISESSEVATSISSATGEVTDMIDAAFVAMGGFGRLQKLSFFFNTAC